ncbi:hypothetical protein [Lentilactobacillus rapi]|uniref:Phage head morphogenesis protein n=3 Tax=Lactobacillaceae TaxID=33958 RepID=A0A512PLF3_9LACO|nr:hypothetical protein [Lentilactobacillus rapi]GEP72021.1 phage head morphogenesis protein [Lentilactobacillus rapi]
MLTANQQRHRIAQLINQDNQTDRQTDKYYDEAMSYIREHLMAFYQQYADENGLSIQQTQQQVSTWDLQEWQSAINEMQVDSSWPQEATDRMKVYGTIAGLDRGHMLTAILALGLIRLTVRNRKATSKRIDEDATQEMTRMKNAFNLDEIQRNRLVQKAQDLKKTTTYYPHQTPRSVITKPETTQIWSKKIWIDTDTMTNDVENLVYKHLQNGMNLQDLRNLLMGHVNPNQFKPNASVADRVKQAQYQTMRIVRSESSRMINGINMATYKMHGITQVEVVGEPGICQYCQGIVDANPYKIDDAPQPPFHPNCRCELVPYLDEQKSLAY